MWESLWLHHPSGSALLIPTIVWKKTLWNTAVITIWQWLQGNILKVKAWHSVEAIIYHPHLPNAELTKLIWHSWLGAYSQEHNFVFFVDTTGRRLAGTLWFSCRQCSKGDGLPAGTASHPVNVKNRREILKHIQAACQSTMKKVLIDVECKISSKYFGCLVNLSWNDLSTICYI